MSQRVSVPISKSLEDMYDGFYVDNLAQWRELGGKYKAEHILRLSQGYGFSKVLECGAGEGSVLKYIDSSALFNELYAIEISSSGISRIKERKLHRLSEVKEFDGYHIPYEDKAFDMVYCSHVIEHVEHPRMLLRELRRVSKFQIFEVPLDYSIGIDRNSEKLCSYGHINVYTPSLFKFLLKSEGFAIDSELLSHSTRDVIEFNWYNNLKLKRTPFRGLLLGTLKIRKFIRRQILGKKRFNEFCYSSFTCLTH